MTPAWTAFTDLVSREIDKVVEKSGILMMVGKKYPDVILYNNLLFCRFSSTASLPRAKLIL